MTEFEIDWTCDEKGVSNSSEKFIELSNAVAYLLNGECWNLMNGSAGRKATARLIMAQLAHKYNMEPSG